MPTTDEHADNMNEMQDYFTVPYCGACPYEASNQTPVIMVGILKMLKDCQIVYWQVSFNASHLQVC
jgi:hypothetical protein